METDTDDMLTFVASLPPITSAVNLDGRGDGARIKLDVPRSDAAAILRLVSEYSGRTFRVVVVDDA